MRKQRSFVARWLLHWILLLCIVFYLAILVTTALSVAAETALPPKRVVEVVLGLALLAAIIEGIKPSKL